MDRVSKVADALRDAGFSVAANRLLKQAAGRTGAVLAGRGPEQVRVGGKTFSLTSPISLASLAETVMQRQPTTPAEKPTRPTPKPQLAKRTALASKRNKNKDKKKGKPSQAKPKAGPIRITVMSPPSEWEPAQLNQAMIEIAAAIRTRVAFFRDNPWFPMTSPYRQWEKKIADKSLMDTLRLRPTASTQQLAEGLLQEAGFGDTYRSSMGRLKGVDHGDVLCDLWAVLASQPRPRADTTVELLVAVGACPLPGRAEPLRRGLTVLFARLLKAELKQKPPELILQQLCGPNLHDRDLQLLEQLQLTVREAADDYAADVIGRLVSCWHGATDVPRAEVAARENAWHAWSLLARSSESDPLVPDEVMRSLLEAAVRHGREHQVYALPTVEYWVALPDRILARMGIERFRFVQQKPGTVQVMCAPNPVMFPLDVPPLSVRRSALYIAMMAAIAHAEMVTRRERLLNQRNGSSYVLQTAGRGGANPDPIRRRVSVGRAMTHSADNRRVLRTPDRHAPRTASYVIPHLRLLNAGDASANAVAHAAEHGITIPDRYTFVRGHIRGDGDASITAAYSVVDVAMETVRRFQANAGSR